MQFTRWRLRSPSPLHTYLNAWAKVGRGTQVFVELPAIQVVTIGSRHGQHLAQVALHDKMDALVFFGDGLQAGNVRGGADWMRPMQLQRRLGVRRGEWRVFVRVGVHGQCYPGQRLLRRGACFHVLFAFVFVHLCPSGALAFPLEEVEHSRLHGGRFHVDVAEVWSRQGPRLAFESIAADHRTRLDLGAGPAGAGVAVWPGPAICTPLTGVSRREGHMALNCRREHHLKSGSEERGEEESRHVICRSTNCVCSASKLTSQGRNAGSW